MVTRRLRRLHQSTSRSTASAIAPRREGKNLKLQLGYSHDVEVSDPGRHQDQGCERPTAIEITGADTPAGRPGRGGDPRLRPPEPYKGKGIKYSTETIRRKEGKKK